MHAEMLFTFMFGLIVRQIIKVFKKNKCLFLSSVIKRMFSISWFDFFDT